LYLSAVIYPGNSESENTGGLNESFYDLGFLKFRMLIIYIFDRDKNLFYGLKIFRLAGMFSLQRGHDSFNIHIVFFKG
jgi:hypothetical protein